QNVGWRWIFFGSAALSLIGMLMVKGTPESKAEGQSSAKFDLPRSEEHTSELQSRENVVCRLLLEKKKSETRQIIASTQVINVTLSEDEGLKGEIVITAYGQQRNKNEITGKVVKLSGEEVYNARMF